MTWLIVAGYSLVALIAARFIWRSVRRAARPADVAGFVFTGLIALLAGVCWPLAVPALIVRARQRHATAELGVSSRLPSPENPRRTA